MNLDFTPALESLGRGAAFQIANGARPPGRYAGAILLPERPMPSYTVEAVNITVRTTMAGLVGMDSPYPPGGTMETAKFMEKAAKLAIRVPLTEEALRQIQEFVMRAMIRGQSTKEQLAQEALNFYQKVVVQAQLDRSEWMRWQCLQLGQLDWTFNKKNILVDYGIPAGNKLTHRTGNDAYGGSASKFWTDYRELRRVLRYNVRAVFAHTDTIDEIVNNPVNAVQVISQDLNQVTIRKYVTINGTTVPSTDARDTAVLTAYDEEGEILDPTNPGQTITIPFLSAGKLVGIGNNSRSGYRPGQGSTDDPLEDLALGYHHMAPTVEGNGEMGRWGDLFTPQDEPWQLVGRGVSNELPVLENPEKVAIMSTDMS